MSTHEDAAANYAGVWGHRIGFGRTPALLVVDFVRAYTEHDSPLFASGVEPAVKATVPLLQAFRASGRPVIHTTVRHTPPAFADGGLWVRKAPVLRCFADARFGQVCEGVEPLEGEPVIVKQYASAFFGTSLAALLTASGIDTIVVTGCTTSGCIRASAVDGVQHGFRVIVPREAVGDRHPAPHEANLFDIDSKYGDVVSVASVLEELARCPGPLS
jgi:maleamate amidohydrolase